MRDVIKNRCDEIRKQHEAATKGPYKHEWMGRIVTTIRDCHRRGAGFMHVADIRGYGYLTSYGPGALNDEAASKVLDANAEFFEHSWQNIADLLGYVEYLSRENDRLALKARHLEEAWEEGRDHWYCVGCGCGFHGKASEAPFHTRRLREPVCSDCGE